MRRLGELLIEELERGVIAPDMTCAMILMLMAEAQIVEERAYAEELMRDAMYQVAA